MKFKKRSGFQLVHLKTKKKNYKCKKSNEIAITKHLGKIIHSIISINKYLTLEYTTIDMQYIVGSSWSSYEQGYRLNTRQYDYLISI